MGSQTYFFIVEEIKIKQLIIEKAIVSFSVCPDDVKDSIQKFLEDKKHETQFVNSRPGVK